MPACIPTAVICGAYTGINNAADDDLGGRLRRRHEQSVAGRGTADLTPAVARRAGKPNVEHVKPDRLSDLDGADSVVAARGLLLDEPVVSNDEGFLDVDGVGVVTY